jgi:hypothetical protein
MTKAVDLHTGGCVCGGVRYVVNGRLRDVVVCHCSRCRRTHGHVAAYTACQAADLEVVSDDTLSWYQADGRARGFCHRCGASLFWHAFDRPTISISAGTLDPPTGLRTIAQIHTNEPGDYYTELGEGEIHPGGPPGE